MNNRPLSNLFSPPTPRKRNRVKNFVSKLHKYLLSVIGGIGILTGLIIGLGKAKEYLDKFWPEWQTDHPITASFFENDSNYHILLLPFTADRGNIKEVCQYHWQVERRINEINKSGTLNLEVKRIDSTSFDSVTPEAVKELGERLGADLVIYGSYQDFDDWDTTHLDIRYVLIDTLIAIPSNIRQGEREFTVSDQESLRKLKNGYLTGSVEDIMHWAMGMREYQRQNYQRALHHWGEVSDSVALPEYSILFGFSAACHYFLGEFDKAIEYYDKAIRLSPDEAYIYNNRGFVHAQLGNYEAAIKDYNKALERDTNYIHALNSRGIAFKNKAFEHNKNRLDLQKALDDHSLAIELDPQDAFSCNSRGLVYADLGEFNCAIDDYDRAIKLDSNYYFAYVNRGVAYHNQGSYSLAWKDFTAAIDLAPAEASAYVNRGYTYSAMKQYESAVWDYNNALIFKPNDPFIYNNRGFAFAMRQKYEAAIADYTRAIVLDSNYWHAYNNRAFAFSSCKNYPAALADYDRYIKFNSEDPYGYLNRGFVYSMMEAYERAIEDYSTAIIKDDKITQAYDYRGFAFVKLGRLQEAKKDYERIKNLDENYEPSFHIPESMDFAKAIVINH